MAKLERVLTGDFFGILRKIEAGILYGNSSSSIGDSSDFKSGSSLCSVRIFERSHFRLRSRIALHVTLFQPEDGKIYLSAITSGGDRLALFDAGTSVEEAFLDDLEQILQSISA